jgi:Tol biopolymer transport system component
VLELASGVLSPVTRTAAEESAPVWSPDGRIIFSSNAKGPYQLYSKTVSERSEESLFASEENTYAKQVYGGGRSLLYLNQNGRGFLSLPLTGQRKPTALFETNDSKDGPRVSPDGRWVAYASNTSGRWEIYTASFPSFSGQRQLSAAGGVQPQWRKDGGELYYLTFDGKVVGSASTAAHH